MTKKSPVNVSNELKMKKKKSETRYGDIDGDVAMV